MEQNFNKIFSRQLRQLPLNEHKEIKYVDALCGIDRIY